MAGAVKGTSIPFTPLCITFENIVYSVDMPKVTNYFFYLMELA